MPHIYNSNLRIAGGEVLDHSVPSIFVSAWIKIGGDIEVQRDFAGGEYWRDGFRDGQCQRSFFGIGRFQVVDCPQFDVLYCISGVGNVAGPGSIQVAGIAHLGEGHAVR